MFTIGQEVTWLHAPKGGYGYQFKVPATVVRIGKKRITIDAKLGDWKEKRIHVKPENLQVR